MSKQIHINLTYKTKADIITSFVGKITIMVGGMLGILYMLSSVFKDTDLGLFAEIVSTEIKSNLVGYCILIAVVSVAIYHLSYQHTLKLFRLNNAERNFSVFDLKKDFDNLYTKNK